MLDFITRLLRSKKNYRDVVSSYREYADLQKKTYESFESTNEKWSAGQQRFIAINFSDIPKSAKILDIACGDGVGLKYFKEHGYADVTGVEFNPRKIEGASSYGYSIVETDMHDLKCFESNTFDVVYSSHTIEHAYYPARMIRELTRVLRPDGQMIVVLPYPDQRDENIPAHGAKFELGTDVIDDGASVVKFFEKCGLTSLAKSFDDFREPEIWLRFTKSS